MSEGLTHGRVGPNRGYTHHARIFSAQAQRDDRLVHQLGETVGKCEIYALVLEGSVDIQGLVAVAGDDNAEALRISWMCTSPENNKLITDEPRYSGVGGHLFAIAAHISQEHGYGGYLYGFAANKDLLAHYQAAFNAEHLGIFHPYHFMVDGENARKIKEAYDYEWTDEEI